MHIKLLVLERNTWKYLTLCKQMSSGSFKNCYLYCIVWNEPLQDWPPCQCTQPWIYMCFNQVGDISTLDGTSLKLVDKFTYLGSSISSTKKDIDMRLMKAWTAIDKLLVIWKSDLTDKMKRSFFQAAVVSILLYGCTTWTLTKQLKKKWNFWKRKFSEILENRKFLTISFSFDISY